MNKAAGRQAQAKCEGRKILLHDLSQAEEERLFSSLGEEVVRISAREKVCHCIGCFGCWIKTPGTCVISDQGSELAPLVGRSDELILLSRNVYGGLSPEIKTALDRVIGILLPYFRIVEGEMHHELRYDHPLRYSVYYYGGDVDGSRREIAWDLAQANALNMGAEKYDVSFYEDVWAAKEGIDGHLAV